MTLKISLVILMSLFAIGIGFNKSDSPAKRFLDLLPESDKADFLILSLGKGSTAINTNSLNRNLNDSSSKTINIQSDSIQKFQALKVPENFETNLYLYTKDTFQLSPKNMDSLIQSRKICFSRRKCISIDDIGNMCCPF